MIKEAEVGLWYVIQRALLRMVTASYFSFGGSKFQFKLVPTSQPETNVRVLSSEEFAST